MPQLNAVQAWLTDRGHAGGTTTVMYEPYRTYATTHDVELVGMGEFMDELRSTGLELYPDDCWR